MKSIREQFEEIWPVPDNVFWSNAQGKYCAEYARDYIISSARKHNEYLDVFTSCQETMFSKEELNLFRQWFNAVEDLSPVYLDKSDCDLYRKVMEALK